jgi:hypothetical protein
MKEGRGYIIKPKAIWLEKVIFTYISIPDEFIKALGLKNSEKIKVYCDGKKIIVEKLDN